MGAVPTHCCQTKISPHLVTTVQTADHKNESHRVQQVATTSQAPAQSSIGVKERRNQNRRKIRQKIDNMFINIEHYEGAVEYSKGDWVKSWNERNSFIEKPVSRATIDEFLEDLKEDEKAVQALGSVCRSANPDVPGFINKFYSNSDEAGGNCKLVIAAAAETDETTVDVYLLVYNIEIIPNPYHPLNPIKLVASSILPKDKREELKAYCRVKAREILYEHKLASRLTI